MGFGMLLIFGFPFGDAFFSVKADLLLNQPTKHAQHWCKLLCG